MKKYVSISLGIILCSLLFIPQKIAYSKKPQSENGYVANQLLVKMKPAVQKDRFARQQFANEILSSRRFRAESLDIEPSWQADADESQAGVYLVQLDGTVSVEEAIREAESDPRVEFAEPNRLLAPRDTIPNDALFNNMWALRNTTVTGADIGAPRAWDLTTGSNNVVVAITDTGVDIQHPDLAANIWSNPGEVANNNIDDDNNGLIDDINGWNFQANNNQLFNSISFDAHGTSVAGIIGAVGNNGTGITGVSWNVKLMPLKFINNGTGDTSGAVKAINYAITQRNKGVNVRVINASWGPTGESCNDSFSKSLKKAIQAAGDAGITFVCSAGNGDCGTNRNGDDLDAAPEYPASWGGELTNVLSVTAVDITDGVPGFSNFGHNNISVAAPGFTVLTTVPRGFSGLPDIASYGTQTGTSFSAPHVTGIAALLAARETALTPTQIKQRIIATAEPILPLASKIKSAGRANAFNALTNTVPAVAKLGVTAVQTSKKMVDIDGLGLVAGQTVIEVNGLAIGGGKFNSDFALANNSHTRVSLKLGKAGINTSFPLNVAVNVTIFNQTTNTRSAVFSFTRR
jgi:large repetitive protein